MSNNSPILATLSYLWIRNKIKLIKMKKRIWGYLMKKNSLALVIFTMVRYWPNDLYLFSLFSNNLCSIKNLYWSLPFKVIINQKNIIFIYESALHRWHTGSQAHNQVLRQVLNSLSSLVIDWSLRRQEQENNRMAPTPLKARIAIRKRIVSLENIFL